MTGLSEKQKLLVDELENQLEVLQVGTESLIYSYEKCQKIGLKKVYSFQELESYEALTSRFARIADILTQKLFKSIFMLLQESPGSFIDKVNLAEKFNIIDSGDELMKIRELRNEIAHEYRLAEIQQIFSDVLDYTKTLLAIVQTTERYAKDKFFHNPIKFD